MKESENGKNKELRRYATASALRYDSGKDKAPVIVAKGRGELAEKIIEIARKENIPVMENKSLAAVLDKLEIYDEIPQELYKAVAQIFAFLYRLDEKAGLKAR